jgi:SCY1-like protein 2
MAVGGDAYMQDTALLTIQYLQALVEKDEVEKAEFFRGLGALLPGIPPRMRHTKVLAHLVDELANPLQVAFVLPNIFAIADGMSKPEFRGMPKERSAAWMRARRAL